MSGDEHDAQTLRDAAALLAGLPTDAERFEWREALADAFMLGHADGINRALTREADRVPFVNPYRGLSK